MRKLFLLVPILLLSSCASLHSTVFAKIHKGDTRGHLVSVLGQPDSFRALSSTDNSVGYYYRRRADTCGFMIENDIITYIQCQTNPNYHGPISSALMGAGKALQENSRTTSNCTTSGGGGLYTTNCN